MKNQNEQVPAKSLNDKINSFKKKENISALFSALGLEMESVTDMETGEYLDAEDLKGFQILKPNTKTKKDGNKKICSEKVNDWKNRFKK